MTDYTYLNQLTVEDLLTYVRRQVNDLAPSVKDHAIRALADRLEEQIDILADHDRLEAELADAEQRANSWREEAAAVQRQLDMVRG